MIAIFDCEVFPNFFSLAWIDRDSDNNGTFYIHKSKSQIEKLYEWLEEIDGLIGFNNINYDYPIIHFLLKNKGDFLIWHDNDAEFMTSKLYNESQRVISADWPSIKSKNVKIPQLDLFLIYHFNNKNKMTSLKAVEIAMNFENVQDLPFHFTHKVKPNEIKSILSYNMNDVLATKELYNRSKDMLQMRRELSEEYNIPLMNANDPKIGEEIFLKMMSEKLNIDPWQLKKLRTHRESIDLAECILPSIKFNSKEFNEFLTKLKSNDSTGNNRKYGNT